jgi:uncharacterized membrane protein
VLSRSNNKKREAMGRSRLLVLLLLACALILVAFVSAEEKVYHIDFEIEDLEDVEDEPMVKIKKTKAQAKAKKVATKTKAKTAEKEVAETTSAPTTEEPTETPSTDSPTTTTLTTTTAAPTQTVTNTTVTSANNQPVTFGLVLRDGYSRFSKRCGKWCQVAVITGVTLLGFFTLGIILLAVVMCCFKKRNAKHVSGLFHIFYCLGKFG